MWKRLGIRVLPSAVLLGVAATAIQATTVVHQVQAVQAAAQVREARLLSQAVAVERYQALALKQTTTDRDAARDEATQLQQERDKLKQQVEQLKQQVALMAYTPSYGSGPVATSGPNHMAPGYCTYYVASKRYIPWFGNAGTWFASAQAFGWPTGYMPRPGAIEVAALSWAGHVAWVESVNPDGSWVVSEENYYAWGVIDRRTVYRATERLIGFIYA